MTIQSPRLPGPAAVPLAPTDVQVLLRSHTAVLELIARAAPLPETLQAIIGVLEELTPGARCSILLLDDDGQTLRHGAAPSLPISYQRAVDGLRIGEHSGSCGAAAWSNAPVHARDVTTDPRWEPFREHARLAGFRACWSTPIRGPGGAPVGTFAVYHDLPHTPTDRERALVARVTHLASVAIGHHHLLAELTDSEERFRRAFDDNAVGMALIGLDRRVERVNRALERMLDQPPSPVRVSPGDPVGRYLRPTAGVGSIRAVLDRLEAGAGDPQQFEAELRRPGADPIPVEATVCVIPDRAGRATRFSLSLLDLTERRAAQRNELARRDAEVARRAAERHSVAKSDLLTIVSHELRTPIQAITGFTELLGRLQLTGEQRSEALRHITSAARQMLGLVDDFLDLSRMETGSLSVEREPVDLASLSADVIGLLAPLARQRQVRIRCDVHGTVRADDRRVRQIVLNLLDNAIRHGRPGGVVQVLTASTADPERSMVELIVRDDGPGFRAELLPRLFTRFEDLGEDERRAVNGFGVGLVLSHQLARLMAGDLLADNPSEGGARLRLRLPSAPQLSPCGTAPRSREGPE